MHMAGEIFVSGSGILRYWSIAILKASVLSSLVDEVLEVINLFTVFTLISARQLECGKVTEDLRWWIPQLLTNFSV